MHPLVREAVKITEDLGPVTFVGAVAVFLHSKNTRESRDLDFAMAKSITKEELLDKGYKTVTEDGKEKTYTPRDYKIDIYSERPLNRISIQTIIDTSKDFEVAKDKTVNAMGLEALIVTKFRANRPEQDHPDLKILAIRRKNDINWKLVESLAESEYELSSIRLTINTLSK